MTYWGILWRSNCKLDGKREFLIHKFRPTIFVTRKEAREHIDEHYGYIRTRKDLQKEPHGWKIPKAVKVKIVMEKK